MNQVQNCLISFWSAHFFTRWTFNQFPMLCWVRSPTPFSMHCTEPVRPKFASAASLEAAPVTLPANNDPRNCVLGCRRLYFPLVAVVDDECRCLDTGAVHLQDKPEEFLINVYDISKWLPSRRPSTSPAKFVVWIVVDFLVNKLCLIGKLKMFYCVRALL